MFGLAVLAAYIPTLLLVVYAANRLRRALVQKSEGTGAKSWAMSFATAAGALLAAAISLGTASLVPATPHSLQGLTFQILITLLLPLAIGLLFALAALPGRVSASTVIANRVGMGAFHGVWVVPVLVAVLTQVAKFVPQGPPYKVAEACFRLGGSAPPDTQLPIKFMIGDVEFGNTITAKRSCTSLGFGMDTEQPSIVLSRFSDAPQSIPLNLDFDRKTCIDVIWGSDSTAIARDARIVDCKKP